MSEDKPLLLIVDDNETNLDLLSRYMCRNGYEVITADNGTKIMEMIIEEGKSFDMILLDLMLPDINGNDVMKKIRHTHSLSELPIILLTAEQDVEVAIDALQSGANDYIIKPVDYNLLKARVETQIKLKNIQLAYKEVQNNLEQLVDDRTEEIKKINIKLENDRERFHFLLSSSPAITYATNYEDRHTSNFISGNAHEILGYSSFEMTETPEFWIKHIHPDDKMDALEKIIKNLTNGSGSVEYRFLHKDGNYVWVHDLHKVITKNGKPCEIIGTWTNITKQYELKEKLEYEASHDELTGLINRRRFEESLDEILDDSQSDTLQHVLCYIDLDQFKIINNTYGHIAGNELLRQISGVLQSGISRSDTLAYLGGDEFGILLHHCTSNQAHRVLSIIQESLHEFRFNWDNKNLAITASIGVIPFNKYSHSSSSILSIANAACYSAKEAGRDRIYFYSETNKELEHKQRQMKWVERIHQALEEDRFYLYFQPIIPLNDNLSEHYELLIRMKDDDGELIPPGAFLPASEQYNLSSKIDRWVIKTILSWIDAYQDILDDESSWGINLSGQSLSDEDLLEFVIDQFDRKQIPPHKIYFEITETAAIANLRNATHFIKTLQKHGCNFALDDFGSGLSSFSYLKNLPVDYIKIDGMFVKDIVKNSTDYAMVKAINDVSQTMNKKTIAEFVENDDIVSMLKAIGVDYAQGFGICKPQPLNEFVEYKSLSKKMAN